MLGIFSKKSEEKKHTTRNAKRNLEDQIISLSQNGWILQVYQNLLNK